jgi:ATP-dependent RNA helicase RhlE
MPQSISHTDQSFSSLGVTPKLLAILTRLHFVTPTPIQAKAIPVARAGRDVVGIAQTGTGKTLAFSLPMIERIANHKKQGVIIVPTRELAEQIAETLQNIGRPVGLRQALIIGGASMGRQISAIGRRPHVIVGTPGRLNDHLERGTLKLNGVGVLVLDEADRMLDMGFAPQIDKILRRVPRQRQTMLFSATMPPEIERLAAKYLTKPVRVQATPSGTVAERVNQELFIVPRQQKYRLLDRLLSDYSGTVLVFSRTKFGAKKICRAIRHMNHAAAEIHSNLTTAQRRRSLAGFRSGAVRIMVATDIASRGIDVSDIELVINYDLPDQLGDYIHRVGRTGRAGKRGKAISFVHPDQRHHIRTIERLVRQKLTVSPLPELPAERAAVDTHREYAYGRGRRQHPPRRAARNRQRSNRRPAYRAGQGQSRARRPRITV